MTERQKQLILCCFDLLPLDAVDGIWGKHSEEATRMLQIGLGIEADGIFGNKTADAAYDWMISEKPLGFDVTDINVGNKSDKDTNVSTKTFWDENEFFTRDEFKCQCFRYNNPPLCDGFPVEPQEKMVRTVNEIRRRLGVPVTIVESGGSGVRCLHHNANVGGVSNSLHLTGNAADLHSDKSPEEMARVAEEVMGKTGEIGIYSWGIHVGIGKYSRFRG